jgi:hypothetical protein
MNKEIAGYLLDTSEHIIMSILIEGNRLQAYRYMQAILTCISNGQEPEDLEGVDKNLISDLRLHIVTLAHNDVDVMISVLNDLISYEDKEGRKKKKSKKKKMKKNHSKKRK